MIFLLNTLLDPYPNLNLPDPNHHLCSLRLPNLHFFVEYFSRPPPTPTFTCVHFDFTILEFIYFYICLDSTTHPHPSLNLPDPNLHLCSIWLSNFDFLLLFTFLDTPTPPPHPNLNLPDPNLHLCSLWLPNFDFFLLNIFSDPTHPPPPQPEPIRLQPSSVFMSMVD